MIDYKEYEKAVYDWLKSKNEEDENFTFSLRMKGSKGNELDYFIGTENSKYFGTTFWTLPVSYPGSSSDCINLIFEYDRDEYFYKFEFGQTKDPDSKQNESALNLLKIIKKGDWGDSVLAYESGDETKMYAFKTEQRANQYIALDKMLKDIEKDMDIIIPLVNKSIEKEKLNNPEFIANRITPDEFTRMEEKLNNRFAKYRHLAECNYWIFQGNPAVYNITNALKGAHLKSWKVAAHKDKIAIGDKVIIWQTGKKAGCYSLAEVTSDVHEFEEEEFEKQHYLKEDTSGSKEGVKIKITDYLAETPILWEDIKELDRFQNFKAGNQGTNFTASKEEYEGLKSLIDRGNTFEKTRSKLKPVAFEKFISFVRRINDTLNLKPNDPRIVYSVRGYKLNFIVGQKYCVNVFTSKNKEDFGIISTKKLSRNNEAFAGKSPKTYYNYMDDLVISEEDWKTVVEAVKSVLEKTSKSGYAKSNDSEFENYVFGLESIKKEGTMNSPLNKILYGPPGTGKTYKLKNEYFHQYTLQETSISKEQHFSNVVLGLTWWQVIALALLETGQENVSSILANRWVAEKANLSESKNVRATIWGTLQMHTIEESETVNYKQRQVPLIFDKKEDKTWVLLKPELDEQSPEIFEILDSVNNFKANPEKTIENFDFVTFHQSFSYEDFIEGIKPVMPKEGEETKELQYQIEDGVFKTICAKAAKDSENRYAIFIDEINRGNVSAIFGELITLIELDKRKGAKNEISIKLPYSKTKFSVPSNLDIYGTMNTADRSVEALDTALRRRFSFEELLPKPELLEVVSFDEVNLVKLLDTINQRIEILIDKDHQIGHSYFFGITSLDDLKLVFQDKIIPLLEEYFYGDFGKIGLVLGEAFIEEQKIQNKNVLAKFDSYDEIDFISDKKIFRLKDIAEMEAKEFISIYETIENN